MINSDYVKEGAVVLDVGINRDENNKLCGDVDFEDVKDKVYAITPVPGGIGPMTITMLLQNTLEAFYHYQLNDIVEMKKQHPCKKSNQWKIVRMGADIKIKCLGCNAIVMFSRRDFEKRLKKVVEHVE